jgi:acylpyruvate hydrolase
MRLVSYVADGEPMAGILIGENLVAVSALGIPARSVRGMLAVLDNEGLDQLAERASSAEPRVALGDVRLIAPVPDPEKIICLGLNYRDHARETGQAIPTAPMWFAKFANSLVGQDEDVILAAAHPDYVDYEAELAVVIGRRAHRVDPQRALEHVVGAMPFNDVSARDLQFQNPLWTSGKAVDTFAPCGPALVTLDEIDDLGSLGLRTRVNGQVVQEGNTREMIFSVAETVAWLSRTITLIPGDIIATGTPAGVGASRNSFLKPGDTVEVEVDGLGVMRNPIRAE